MPRNLRNNNPGNIEYGPYAKKHGATGSDGRFAIFPDMKTGEDAMANLLMGYMKEGNNTISKIVGKWSPSSDPTNPKGSTQNYINQVAKKTGIDPNKPLSSGELGAVQKAMTNHEGMVGAYMKSDSKKSSPNTTSSVNIQNQVINTQATDANGIAKDMKMSLENNSLINYGMVGNR